jgi:hypothetical protein
MLLNTFIKGNGNLAENKGEWRVSDLQHQCAPPELAHLPEGYEPGVNVLECKIILGLDSYHQFANSLVLCNPDWEGTIDPTQEQDLK